MTAALYLDLLKRTADRHGVRGPAIAVADWHPHTDYQPGRSGTGNRLAAACALHDRVPGSTNVQECVERVLDDERCPGDLVEAGVWRGGTCIFMRALLKVHGVTDRCVWAIDSFAGLPRARTGRGGTGCAVPLAEVQHNFGLYGLLDEQVRFLPGWFSDSLPAGAPGRLAILRLDGDLYESADGRPDTPVPEAVAWRVRHH